MGKLISQALGYCFFDSDSLIEQIGGRSVAEIFAEEGEESFRWVECVRGGSAGEEAL